MGPYDGSRGGGVYLAVYRVEMGGAPRFVLQFRGKLGEAGVLRLAPHDGAGLAPLDIPVAAGAALDLWRDVRAAFDDDFAAAHAAWEAQQGGEDTKSGVADCSDGAAYRAWIAEDGPQVRPPPGPLAGCGGGRWEAAAAAQLHAIARAALGACVSEPADWNGLMACLPKPEEGER